MSTFDSITIAPVAEHTGLKDINAEISVQVGFYVATVMVSGRFNINDDASISEIQNTIVEGLLKGLAPDD